MKRRLALNVFPVLALTLVLGACAHHGSKSEPAAPAKLDNPAQEVTLRTPIQFADSANVRDAVRSECRLQGKLAKFIKQFGAEQNIKVGTSSDPASQIGGKVLDVRITRVHAPGGGAYSGAKGVTIAGELTENGNQLGSFKARRISGGGAFAAFKGTCNILGRDVEALGQDVAKFMASPVEGARMGNL